MAALLTLSNLHVWLGDDPQNAVRAVDGISLEIQRGETFALLGESGCGKSMTALSIMQLLPEMPLTKLEGDVFLGNENLLNFPERKMRTIRGKRIAMIFQEPMTSLNPVMTVGKQIGEVLQFHLGIKGVAQREHTIQLLEQVGLPDPQQRLNEYPYQLSGGMKQRLMIAMALAGEPDLLIADEPTTALDVTTQAQILDLLKQLQQERGMAILLITHDLGVVAEMADHVGIMYAGQLVETASRHDLFTTPAHPYTRKLFEALPGIWNRARPLSVLSGTVPALNQQFSGCRFQNRCNQTWKLCKSEEPVWFEIGNTQIENTGKHQIRCHLGQYEFEREPIALDADSDSHFRRDDEGNFENNDENSENSQSFFNANSKKPANQQIDFGDDFPILEINQLKIHFPTKRSHLFRKRHKVRAVDGINLTVPEGKTVALVGESGCGKTTVGRAILQLLQPADGTVSFAGTNLNALWNWQLRKRRADFQMIFQDPFASMNPRMQVREILREGIDALLAPRPDDALDLRLKELLAQVELPEDALDRYPHQFSGGQRQRIAIARALAVEPKLLICDEPTSALDVSVQAQILNLLRKLQQERGLSYLFITHDLSVVSWVADEVAVMYLGKIVEQGATADVLESPRHPYTQALLSAAPQISQKIAQQKSIQTETDGKRIILKGDLPSALDPPDGCPFHPRCPLAEERCVLEQQKMVSVRSNQRVACHLSR